MACPLFIPSSPLGELVSVATPLGDLYGGSCAADPSAVIDPETLRRYCNFGYARGHCPRAAESDSDAVRLLVRAEHGGIVEIAWAVERNHHPVAVGTMEIMATDAQTGSTATETEILARQASACAAAYLRQIHPTTVESRRLAAGLHP